MDQRSTTKEKISLIKLGKISSKEAKNKMKESWTDERRKKISEMLGTTIFLYSLDHQLINSFTSSRGTPTEFFNCDKKTIIKYARSGAIFKKEYILSLEKLSDQPI